jgi:hypothetical protein
MKIVKNADMSQYTSFRAGGKAAVLVLPETVDAVRTVLKILDENGTPHMMISLFIIFFSSLFSVFSPIVYSSFHKSILL